MTRYFMALTIAMLMGLAALEAQSRQENIGVRGHWIMEVTNPDGSLSARREFDNHFWGDEGLSGLLAGDFSMAGWLIGLQSGYVADYPWSNDSHNELFMKSAASQFQTYQGVTPTLSSWVGYVNNRFVFNLKGSAVAVRAGKIRQVSTKWFSCPPSVSPNDCRTGPGPFEEHFFTFIDVANSNGVVEPLQIVPEQKLTVAVTLSFGQGASTQTQGQ